MNQLEERRNLTVGTFLVLYLLVVGVGAAALVIANFPDPIAATPTAGSPATQPEFWPFGNTSSVRVLLALAFFAGMAGSFLHAAQSLSSYLGNRTFRASWAVWYMLRPWIGGILGLIIYVVLRAGLMGGGPDVNAYSIAALGALGGWFSKTATDKLQEVFETLFKTDADAQRTGKLKPQRPVIDDFEPKPVPAGVNEVIVKGKNFHEKAQVLIDDVEVDTTFKSAAELKVSLANVTRGKGKTVQVRNPEGADPLSAERTLDID